MEIDQSVTVITGAAAGIGLATARALLDAGGRVLLTDIDGEELAAATANLESQHAAHLVMDVRDPESCREALPFAEDALGAFPNVWINNAGLARHKPIVDYTPEDIELMTAVNLKGVFFGSQAALREFAAREIRGHIVNLVSTAALRGIPTESFYCATKWAVRGFTEGLAEEAAPLGVKVTAVLPGGVDTSFWERAVDHPMPVESFLTPDQVALAILDLLAQDGACVTRELVLRALEDRDFAGR